MIDTFDNKLDECIVNRIYKIYEDHAQKDIKEEYNETNKKTGI